MKIRKLIALLAIILMSGCHQNEGSLERDESIKNQLPTEQFLQKHLMGKDGRMQTNMTDRQDEYLSETLGLWMEYLLITNDEARFREQVDVLKDVFLAKNGLVIWEVKNEEESSVNAFIDDLRVVDLLYLAGEQWNERSYTKLANKMSKALARYQTKDQFLVDFVDIYSKEKGSDVTLSYIMPGGLDKMKKKGHLPQETYDGMRTILGEAPVTSTGFFPKKYNIDAKEYIYEDEINMIDQFYIGYHRAKWGKETRALMQNAKEIFQANEGKIYGRYDAKTKEPTVGYESVAAYALAILMSFEVGEIDFANDLYEQMKTLRVNDEASSYYGGYMNLDTKETHTFDNLLALIVERKGKDESYFIN